LREEKCPTWFPVQFNDEWNKTDLTFEFCIKLFAQLEAVKRENFPKETARQWFIEFVRRGWTKKMLQRRYDALMSTKIYGIEKLEMADWVNAIPVMAMDEVNLLVKQRIDTAIANGKFLKDRVLECSYTDEQKEKISLYEADLIKRKFEREQLEANEDWVRQERIRIKKGLVFKENNNGL